MRPFLRVTFGVTAQPTRASVSQKKHAARGSCKRPLAAVLERDVGVDAPTRLIQHLISQKRHTAAAAGTYLRPSFRVTSVSMASRVVPDMSLTIDRSCAGARVDSDITLDLRHVAHNGPLPGCGQGARAGLDVTLGVSRWKRCRFRQAYAVQSRPLHAREGQQASTLSARRTST